jgi:hypothetical protein
MQTETTPAPQAPANLLTAQALAALIARIQQAEPLQAL